MWRQLEESCNSLMVEILIYCCSYCLASLSDGERQIECDAEHECESRMLCKFQIPVVSKDIFDVKINTQVFY